MTELSFLIDLLLNHKLPKATRDAVAARIKEVEASGQRIVTNTIEFRGVQSHQLPPGLVGQSASTQAAMLRHAGEAPFAASTQAIEALQPVIIAQTQAAQAAIASRQQAIAESVAGKIDKTTGRPRKF